MGKFHDGPGSRIVSDVTARAASGDPPSLPRVSYLVFRLERHIRARLDDALARFERFDEGSEEAAIGGRIRVDEDDRIGRIHRQ